MAYYVYSDNNNNSNNRNEKKKNRKTFCVLFKYIEDVWST